jgi:hypothetical protein
MLPENNAELPRTEEPSTVTLPVVITSPMLDGAADATLIRQLQVNSETADCNLMSIALSCGALETGAHLR